MAFDDLPAVLDLLATTVQALAEPSVDAQEVLQKLAERAVVIFAADDAGILVRDAVGGAQVLVATSAEARLAELFQVDSGDGPCMEAFTSAAVVRVDSAASAATRWPAWSRQGHRSFESVLGAPFDYAGQRIGTLNLMSARIAAFDDAAAAAAARLAEVISVVLLLDRRLADERVLSSQLQSALDSRIVIEQAKGMVAESLSITPDEAFTRLRSAARSTGRRLHDVAVDVVSGRARPGSPTQPR